MITVKLTEEKALKMFDEATDKKDLMTKLFGRTIFTNKITDRVKTFADACKIVGIKPETVCPYKKPKNDQEKAINAYAMIRIIALALNEGWKPNWNDSSESKYYPWFKGISGVGFSCDDCDCDSSDTAVGSRLCYSSSNLAEYAGKQFLSIYKAHITL